jgi:hypothetical protein
MRPPRLYLLDATLPFNGKGRSLSTAQAHFLVAEAFSGPRRRHRLELGLIGFVSSSLPDTYIRLILFRV